MCHFLKSCEIIKTPVWWRASAASEAPATFLWSAAMRKSKALRAASNRDKAKRLLVENAALSSLDGLESKMRCITSRYVCRLQPRECKRTLKYTALCHSLSVSQVQMASYQYLIKDCSVFSVVFQRASAPLASVVCVCEKNETSSWGYRPFSISHSGCYQKPKPS